MLVSIDWVRLVQLQVPQWLRRKRLLAWLLLCVSQVRALHSAFLAYRKAALYNLHITGQTIYLEKALNDRFDFVNRLIWIETATDLNQFFLRNKVEFAAPVFFYNKYNQAYQYVNGEYATSQGRLWKAIVPLPVHPPGENPAEWSDEGEQLYLKNRSESQVQFDFTIWVPAALVYDENELRALVAIYKLAGKRYNIISY